MHFPDGRLLCLMEEYLRGGGGGGLGSPEIPRGRGNVNGSPEAFEHPDHVWRRRSCVEAPVRRSLREGADHVWRPPPFDMFLREGADHVWRPPCAGA